MSSLTKEQYKKLKEDRAFYKIYLKGSVVWPRKDSFFKRDGDDKIYQVPYIKRIHGVIGSRRSETLQKRKSLDNS